MNKMIIMAMLFTSSAFSHEFKSKDFCSAKTTDICGHIGYDKKPEKNKVFEFTVDIINKAKAKEISGVVISAIAKGESLPTTWIIRPDGHHWDTKTNSVIPSDITAIQVVYNYKSAREEMTIQLK